MRIRPNIQADRNSRVLRTPMRAALMIADLFTASTAVGGGVALATGLEGDRIPVDWLERTPFRSYRVPGLILSIAVGGTATIASAATIRGSRFTAPTSIAAGLTMIGWIAGEMLLLEQPNTPTIVEIVYLADGLALTALGLLLARIERARPHRTNDRRDRYRHCCMPLQGGSQ